MWMSSRFASWDVEGEVRQRVNEALRTMEQERLARAVRGTEAERTPARVLSAIYAGLERLGKMATRCGRRRAATLLYRGGRALVTSNDAVTTQALPQKTLTE